MVVGAVDQEGSESHLIAELVGSQECIFEESCAYASSLHALIDGESREEENWAWLRSLARFEGIWEFAALHCPGRVAISRGRGALAVSRGGLPVRRKSPRGRCRCPEQQRRKGRGAPKRRHPP